MSEAHPLPILYSFRRCPYAMRARLSLYARGISVELREVVLKDKPAHMIEISPKATVPVLLLPNGHVIDESLDVMTWSVEQVSAAPQIPTIKAPTSDMLDLIKIIDGPFKHHLDRYKYANRYEDENAIAEEHRDQTLEILEVLEKRLSNHEHLFGPTLSFADIAIAPFIRQFAHTDINWFNTLEYDNLKKWLFNFIDGETFKAIMTKYPQWKVNETITLFPELD